MRFVTFTAEGETRVGLAVEGLIIDLSAAARALPFEHGVLATLPRDLRELLEAGEPALRTARRVQDWLVTALGSGDRPRGAAGEQIVFERREVKLRAPIVRPGKIICLGQNYADHAREGGSPIPTTPVLFAKFANTVIGTDEPIVHPRATQRLDYEAEMAVVIGRRAKGVSQEAAMDYVAGYMNFHDVSARDLQNETSQYFKGKSADTFGPCGPYLVTKDEVPDPHALAIRCYLNGELMQSSNTSELIFRVPFLVHHISRTITLEPGDIISTGTPSGVGDHRNPPRYLRPGDVVRVEVAGLGVLENSVVAE